MSSPADRPALPKEISTPLEPHDCSVDVKEWGQAPCRPHVICKTAVTRSEPVPILSRALGRQFRRSLGQPHERRSNPIQAHGHFFFRDHNQIKPNGQLTTLQAKCLAQNCASNDCAPPPRPAAKKPTARTGCAANRSRRHTRQSGHPKPSAAGGRLVGNRPTSAGDRGARSRRSVMAMSAKPRGRPIITDRLAIAADFALQAASDPNRSAGERAAAGDLCASGDGAIARPEKFRPCKRTPEKSSLPAQP